MGFQALDPHPTGCSDQRKVPGRPEEAEGPMAPGLPHISLSHSSASRACLWAEPGIRGVTPARASPRMPSSSWSRRGPRWVQSVGLRFKGRPWPSASAVNLQPPKDPVFGGWGWGGAGVFPWLAPQTQQRVGKSEGYKAFYPRGGGGAGCGACPRGLDVQASPDRCIAQAPARPGHFQPCRDSRILR